MGRTLVLIKPDAVEKGLCGTIIERYEQAGLQIKGTRVVKPSRELAEKHYEEHKGKDYFEELIQYITRGNIMAIILDGELAVRKVREIHGNSDPDVAEDGTIRSLYGTNATENAVHASDSASSAEREIEIWFNDCMSIEEIRSTRPQMDKVEYFFKIAERPSAVQSREMADYIYKLERYIVDNLEK